MKRIITAVILLLVLIAFCFWSYAFLNRTTFELASSITEAQQSIRADDFTGAAERMAQSYQLWDSRISAFGALVRHDELDDIEKLYVRARQAVDSKDAGEALLHTSELRSVLLHLSEMEALSFQNIF